MLRDPCLGFSDGSETPRGGLSAWTSLYELARSPTFGTVRSTEIHEDITDLEDVICLSENDETT